MSKVLVVTTSRKTHGGISAVLKLYEHSQMWKQYHCNWIATHRDGGHARKLWYLINGMVQYILLLPFYDIVHFHFSLPRSAKRKLPFFKLARILGKKTVIHLHCGSQIDEIWNDTYQQLFEKCDVGILLSNGLKSKIEERIGESNHLRVVYNPCPIISETTYYKKQSNILFSGVLNQGKGYRVFISAFAKIAHLYPRWKIVLAGDGEIEQARTLACELGIEDQVELLGWVSGEAKHKAFCEASVFCLPSYAEGFPMAVLDAWAYGLPVITTPVGGIPDVAIDGVNMALFFPGDSDGLSEKMKMIISDDELRLKIANESRKLAMGKFSLTNVTKQVASIYDELLLDL